MDALLTLSCPSCGATLEVTPGAKEISCKYCGNHHVFPAVQPAALLDYPLCPLGAHQDDILKVPVVMKTQVFEAPSRPESGTPVFYQSELAQKLFCPPKPRPPFTFLLTRGGLLFTFIVLLGIFAIAGSAFTSILLPNSGPLGFGLFCIVGAFILIPIATTRLAPRVTEINDAYEKKLDRWQTAKNRWDKSYYCLKHDIVLVDGYDQAIPLDKYQAFLRGK